MSEENVKNNPEVENNPEAKKITFDNNGKEIPEIWSARKSVKALEYIVGTSFDVKMMLADKLRDGLIRAYAYRTWEADNPNFYQVWKSGPAEDAVDKAKINRSIMRRSNDWSDTLSQWDWRKGNFVAAHNGGKKFKFYHDVRFVADDILKLRSAAEHVLKLKQGKGRQIKQDEWTKMWLAAIRLIVSGELKDKKYQNKRGGQKLFFKAIESTFQNKEKKEKVPLGLESFGSDISLILKEFCESFEVNKSEPFADRSSEGGDPENFASNCSATSKNPI